MIQIHKDHLLIGTTTNSILTAQLSATTLKNPLAGVELNEVPLTQVGVLTCVFLITIIGVVRWICHEFYNLYTFRVTLTYWLA